MSWSEPNKIDPGVPDVMAQIPLNENGFDWIRQQVCGDWDVEATFCIPCEDSCDCPDNYECICYVEIEARRRMEKNLDISNEAFLLPDQVVEEETYHHHSSQTSTGNKPPNEPRHGRRMKSEKSSNADDDSSRSNSSKSCKSEKVGKQCNSDESGYCFRSDTSLVDDFSGKKSSSASFD